jgi:hypothetical protein
MVLFVEIELGLLFYRYFFNDIRNGVLRLPNKLNYALLKSISTLPTIAWKSLDKELC